VAVALGVAPADLVNDREAATSPEMLATIINYLNWQAERRQAQSRRR